MSFRMHIALGLTLLLLLSLCACAQVQTPAPGPAISQDPAGTDPDPTEPPPPVVDPTAVPREELGPVPEDPADANIPWTFGESPVPNQRTGIKRQGISIQKYYEYTDTGFYIITFEDSVLLYADYGSDTFIPVCARPDCSHSDTSCDASIHQPVGICRHDGNMYLANINGVYKTDAAFTDREQIFSVGTLGAYTALSQCQIWNGVFNFGFTALDASGQEVFTPYYYKLDGSMREAEVSDMSLAVGNHGDVLLGYTIDKDTLQWGIERWDPDTNTATYLCDLISWDGYYATEYAIVRQDSVVCSYTYADKRITPIMDTGLEGELILICFPDCIVMAQMLEEEYYLHFYDWSFEALGSAKLDFPILDGLFSVICGETEDRIILAATCSGTPEYYIEKSDFGTGSIEVHAYTLPKLKLFDQAKAEAQKAAG